MNEEKKNCKKCKNLPEGVVVKGHDHRTFQPEEKKCPCEKCVKNGIFMDCLKDTPQPKAEDWEKKWDDWVTSWNKKSTSGERGDYYFRHYAKEFICILKTQWIAEGYEKRKSEDIRTFQMNQDKEYEKCFQEGKAQGRKEVIDSIENTANETYNCDKCGGIAVWKGLALAQIASLNKDEK